MLKQVAWLSLVLSVPLIVACSDTLPTANTGDPGSANGGPTILDDPPAVPGCLGSCVPAPTCPTVSPTMVTGTVSIPSGTLPLYNAKVYIPTGDELPGALSAGPSCDHCDASSSRYSTTTDINGNFVLSGIPSGQNIPLVIKVGKWRRMLTLPTIADCTTTALDPTQTRLPRNQSEGNIPKIALSTGGADALECLLRSQKLGIDDAEFTNPAGGGRVNLFAGGESFNQTAGTNRYAASLNNGAAFPTANPWWNDVNNWNKYDIVLLSCEGDQNAAYKSPAAHQSLLTFLNEGGRVFASHWQNVWISGGPAPLNTVASFLNTGGYVNDTTTISATINQSFTKGIALASWLQNNGATTTLGQLPINYARMTLTQQLSAANQDWVDFSAPTALADGVVAPGSQYFSFKTPIGSPANNQCGEMVFTDIHVSGGKTDVSTPSTPFPTGCTSTGLSAQEKALIFLLFDLTNCLPVIIG